MTSISRVFTGVVPLMCAGAAEGDAGLVEVRQQQSAFTRAKDAYPALAHVYENMVKFSQRPNVLA
ncbi:hypothetical protein ABIB57_003207 [Devosia sp. UYZn731]